MGKKLVPVCEFPTLPRMEFRTVPGVEIISTGTYDLGSGKTTFTANDLKAAVLAASDPTVLSPRIKLGHTDRRFEADESLDGEPAFGTVANMRLDADGHKIVGDLTGVPAWLADSMESAFPGRSIEGGFNFKAPSGREYDLVISDLALLGTTWPGITSLDDLREVMERNGKVEPVAASGSPFSVPVTTRVTASLDTGAIPRTFAADLAANRVPAADASEVGPQTWWWPRNVLAEEDGSLTLVVDDDKGHLLRLPVRVEGNVLNYGKPVLAQQSFEPLSASGSYKGPRVLASWPGSADRPGREATMDVDRNVLIKRLGLAEDASDADIQQALVAETPGEQGGGNGDEGKPAEGKPAEGEGDGEGKPAEQPAGVAASHAKIPEGMALIDSDTLARLKQGAEAGLAIADDLARNERDTTITAAINGGKFAAGRREHYETAWDADPEGTKALIASLAEGMIPVQAREVGRSGDGDDAQSDEAQLAAMEYAMFPELRPTTAGGAS